MHPQTQSQFVTTCNHNNTCIDSQMSDSNQSDSEFEDIIPLARLAQVCQHEEADSYIDNFSEYESSESETN